jgi:hypothetical protein
MLFLDEPTSGLDSHSASNLVKLLKVISLKNCAILCTIHQPSSEVFSLFDKVIFMAKGRIFYQGSVPNISLFFGDRGNPCPENYNPADFVMNLCQSVEGDDLEKLFMPVPDDCLSEKSMGGGGSHRQEMSEMAFQVQSSFGKQMVNLAYREFVGLVRDTGALQTRFSVTILLNLLYGLIFLGAGGKDNADANNFSAHVGGIMIATIYSMFGSAQPIMLSFPYERPMFLREYSTGTCKSCCHYFLSTLILSA